ncbi:hypothetical protein, partial [Streptococcus pyogenes]
AKQMIDLKRNLFKIDVRAQKDEEKVFMRTAWNPLLTLTSPLHAISSTKSTPDKCFWYFSQPHSLVNPH